MLEVVPEQHFTQPPPRYCEASLVKTLEELGIGRPSTYASIIDTIQRRQYVTLEDKRFTPTDTGEVVTDKLIEHFPDVVDVTFTAFMEKELDDIAVGELGKVQMLHEFNGPFERALEKADHAFERFSEELDEECPLCPTEGRDPGNARGQAGALRQVRRVHELPGLPVHPQHGRQRASRARDARRDLPRVRQAAPEEGGPLRSVHRMQRLPRLQVHQEGPARLDRRHVPAVRPGRADREAQPVRHDVLQLQPLPRLRLRRGQPAREGPPMSRMRLVAAPPPQVAAMLGLRRRARSGVST